MLTRRADGVRLGATPIEIRPDGYRVYRGRAAFGNVVLDYPEDGRSEFVPAEVALSDEALASTVGVPFTVVHPDDLLTADAEDDIRRHAEGVVLAARADWTANPPEMVVDVIVHTKSAQEAVESGRVTDLSLGYRAEDKPQRGTAGGKPYQFVQTRRLSNHLSAVPIARSTAPDGRRARLDQAAADAPYARRTMDETNLDAPPPDDTELVVADPGAPVLAVEALEAFSPEDAEILKTLSPEGQTMLAAALKQVKAEAAEQAVMATPIEVDEVDDASKAAKAKEAIGEDLKIAAKKAEGAVEDASIPNASQALTMDAVNKMIADALAAAGVGAKKADAATALPAPITTTPAPAAATNDARLDADAIAAKAAAKVTAQARMDAEFVGVARKDGHVKDGATIKDAATAMMAVVTEHLPLLIEPAKDFLRNGKRDAFVGLYRQAEQIRRDALVADQQSIFTAFHTHASEDATASLLASVSVPARSTSG